MKDHEAELSMEITVLSGEGLGSPLSSLLPCGRRLRPFVALFVSSAADEGTLDGLCFASPLHYTRVDERGAENPCWGDKIRLPLEPSFLRQGGGGGSAETGVHLAVLSKRPFGGPAKLGWCRITPDDVLDGLRPPSALRRLSFALRDPRRASGRARGVIHLAVQLVGRELDLLWRLPPAVGRPLVEEAEWRGLAIGIPVVWPAGRAVDPFGAQIN